VTTRVIHFGRDDGKRLPVLRSAGYEVHEAYTLNDLWIELEQNERVDAVFISEGDSWITNCAVMLVREYNAAPLVLFRRTSGDCNENPCDEVYSSDVRHEEWLSHMSELIARCRDSQSKRCKAQSVTELSRWQRARARMLKRNVSGSGTVWQSDKKE
jgi:hypothetical protein